MSFALCVAADCNGAKVNLEFLFAFVPTVAQVLSRSIEAFDRIFRLKNIVRPFAISSAVIFNDPEKSWDRLERSVQLSHNAQIYLFQPNYHERPAEIPDPIPGSDFLAEYASPPRQFAEESPRAAGPIVYEAREAFLQPSPNFMSEIRSQRLKEMEKHRGEVIPGPSILAEERERANYLMSLPVDEHRQAVRQDEKKFRDSISPPRN